MPGFKFQGVYPRKNLVVRTPCFSASYPQGVRVPPVKNHCSKRFALIVIWVTDISKLSPRLSISMNISAIRHSTVVTGLPWKFTDSRKIACCLPRNAKVIAEVFHCNVNSTNVSSAQNSVTLHFARSDTAVMRFAFVHWSTRALICLALPVVDVTQAASRLSLTSWRLHHAMILPVSW